MKTFCTIVIFALGLSFVITNSGNALAATTAVNLGTAGNFVILAGEGITNVPTSVIIGNVGLSPAAGDSYDGGVTQAQITGSIFSVNAAGPLGYIENASLLTTAKNDLTTAFIDASGRLADATVPTELGGTTKTSGVYVSESTTFEITAGEGGAPLVLDGQGNAASVFIFKMGAEGTGLTAGPGSTVSMINGAQACNIFWIVDTAEINTTAIFKGNILALNSITVANGANIEGRLLARNGNVTLISDTITMPICTAAAPIVTEAPIVPSPSQPPVVGLPVTGADSERSPASPFIFIAAAIIVITTLCLTSRKRISSLNLS